MLQIQGLRDQVALLESKNKELIATNKSLGGMLEDQRNDQADVYNHIHKKLDRALDTIAILEEDRENSQKESSLAIETLHKQLQERKNRYTAREEELEKRVDGLSSELHDLHEFVEMKDEYEAKISGLEKEIKDMKDRFAREQSALELSCVQDKERLKKEMQERISETKRDLLTLTQHRLDGATKETIDENSRMTFELHYQNRETEKMLSELANAEREKKAYKREIVLLQTELQECAKRSNLFKSYTETMKKYSNYALRSVVKEGGEGEDRGKKTDQVEGLLRRRVRSLLEEIRVLKSESSAKSSLIEGASSLLQTFLTDSGDSLRSFLLSFN
mmetsp:Transcript_18279/g.31108  ORF Transcript_18279/g.31108 Transcript_18279/m.31108 type:complete len:333 (+) Transcript_18279:64-1062(+)